MLLSLLFPEKCIFCGEVIQKSPFPVCEKCSINTPVIKGERCKYCGGEYNACLCKLGDYAFTRNISVYKYEGAASTIIKRFKFGKKIQLADFIAREMAITIKREYSSVKFE